MKRLGAVLAAVAAGTLLAGSAYAWPGRPKSSPPRPENGPPAAWAETTRRSFWLAFGSYCWTSAGTAVCVDMIPPQSRSDLPVVRVDRGAVIRIHLAFVPRDAHLTLFHGSSFTHSLLRPAQTLSWRASRQGIASLDVQARGGSASYLLRVALRS